MLCVLDGEVLICYVLALLMTHVEGGPLQSLAQLLTLCISYAFCICKLSSHLLTIRGRVAVNMQGTVFILARLKIVPSYIQEIVSHPMPEHIEASCITKYLEQPFPDRY